MKIIMSLYKCVKTKVFVNGQTSSFEYKLGVRQGECLSPFLFAMYVNDMEEVFSRGNTGVTVDDVKLFLLFYADDAVIFAESAEQLQNGIDILFKYCNRWKLKLTTDKSHVIVFKRGRKGNKEKWVYGTMELKVTINIDYLGLRLSSTGSFHQEQQKLASQANKAVFTLQNRLNNYPYLTPKHAMELFDKMISPILCYASEVLGFHDAPDIERVQLKFCKTVLGVKPTVQNDLIYGELNRLPMKCVRLVNIVRYWLKLVHGEKSRYVMKCYVNALAVGTNDGKCWVNCLKVTLRHCELCNTDVEDEFHFMLECPVYASIRKQLINGYYWRRPSMHKLVKLFNTTKRKEIIALAKYVYQAFNLRRELIAVN